MTADSFVQCLPRLDVKSYRYHCEYKLFQLCIDGGKKHCNDESADILNSSNWEYKTGLTKLAYT